MTTDIVDILINFVTEAGQLTKQAIQNTINAKQKQLYLNKYLQLIQDKTSSLLHQTSEQKLETSLPKNYQSPPKTIMVTNDFQPDTEQFVTRDLCQFNNDQIMHIAQVNNNFILVGLKTGVINVYRNFQFVQVLPGVDQMCCLLVSGDHLFIGGMKRVFVLSSYNLELYSTISTSEWVFSICQLNEDFLLCGQSYGYIDCFKIQRKENKLKGFIKTQLQQSSHIYSVIKTTDSHNERIEFAIGSQTGLYLGSIQNAHFGISQEIYLQNQCVRQILEFEPNRFVIGIDNHPAYVILDRSLNVKPGKQIIEVFSKTQRVRCSMLQELTVHPYILGRNANCLDLINVETGRARILVDTKMNDRQYFNTACITQIGDVIRVYYIEESGNTTLDYSSCVKVIEFNQELIEQQRGIV